MRSLLFVFFSYNSKAVLRIDWKLEDEEDEGARSWDMTDSVGETTNENW